MAGKHPRSLETVTSPDVSNFSFCRLTGCRRERSSITQGRPTAAVAPISQPLPYPAALLSQTHLHAATDSRRWRGLPPTLGYTACWRADKREAAQLHFGTASTRQVIVKENKN